jgi:trk system potassium uptake protein TrkA
VHIVVVGCGRVGSELAIELDREGHSVAVVDKDRQAFRRLPGDWSGRTVVGFGFDRDHLRKADIDHAEALAAVSSGDNTNVLTARIAKEKYGIEHVVARIYDPRRAAIYQKLGIATVATVTWTVEQAIRRLFPDRMACDWTDASGQIMLVERTLPPARDGTPLRQLVRPPAFRLISVTRAGRARLDIEDLVAQGGDVLNLAVRRDALSLLETALAQEDAR